MKKLYRLTIAVIADEDSPEFADRSPDAVIAEKWLANEDTYPDFGRFEVMTSKDGIPTFEDYAD